MWTMAARSFALLMQFSLRWRHDSFHVMHVLINYECARFAPFVLYICSCIIAQIPYRCIIISTLQTLHSSYYCSDHWFGSAFLWLVNLIDRRWLIFCYCTSVLSTFPAIVLVVPCSLIVICHVHFVLCGRNSFSNFDVLYLRVCVGIFCSFAFHRSHLLSFHWMHSLA